MRLPWCPRRTAPHSSDGRRAATSASTPPGPGASAPYWVRLVRAGTRVTALRLFRWSLVDDDRQRHHRPRDHGVRRPRGHQPQQRRTGGLRCDAGLDLGSVAAIIAADAGYRLAGDSRDDRLCGGHVHDHRGRRRYLGHLRSVPLCVSAGVRRRRRGRTRGLPHRGRSSGPRPES